MSFVKEHPQNPEQENRFKEAKEKLRGDFLILSFDSLLKKDKFMNMCFSQRFYLLAFKTEQFSGGAREEENDSGNEYFKTI